MNHAEKAKLPEIEDYEYETSGAYIRVSISPWNMGDMSAEEVEKVRKVLDALGLLDD